MSTTTPNLGLFKYNPTTDANVPFNIVTALNNNWDILDSNGTSPRDIGEVVKSNVPLIDATLHERDGSLIQRASYTAFVDHMANLYQEHNPQSTAIKGAVITLPTFSSNTQDGITISDARNNTTNLQALFNGTTESVAIGRWESYWISIDYGQSTILDSYILQADNGGSPEYPSDWIVQGSNDATNWEVIDTRTGITFSLNESKTFFVTTNNTYRYYGIVFSNGVHSGDNGELKRIIFKACTTINALQDDIFATQEEWQHFITTYGMCGKFVYNSSNNTVRLPKITAGHGELFKCRYENNSWYRIYIDGWCEQGGCVNLSNGNKLTFQNTFKDTEYNIVACPGGVPTNSTTDGNWLAYPTTRYVDGCIMNLRDSDGTEARSGPVQWMACGYISLPSTEFLPQYEYLVLATSVKSAVRVDIDEIVTDLNGKVNTADLEEVKCVIETYSSGTSWYRIWSDGWCEQGGKIVAGTDGMTPISLLKTYASEPQIYISRIWRPGGDAGGSAVDRRQITISSPSVSGFDIWTNGWSNIDMYWEAKGYIY